MALCAIPANAAEPPGFQIRIVAAGLTLPTQMAFAPDGSIYVAEKNGKVRRAKDGVLLPDPVITLSDVNNYGDRGLIGLALDPNFSANGFMYLMYTHENSPGFNYAGSKTVRIVRVTVSDGKASVMSAVVIAGSVAGDINKPSCNDFPAASDCIPVDAGTHAGGGLRFGPDGKLYASFGDGAEFTFADPNARRALDLDSLAGKIIRVNADGTAPSDNPYYNGDPNANRSKVWTYGHRNSLRFSFRPLNGRLYFGDVGWFSWEEINVGVKGGNYGWPCREGMGTTTYNCATANYIDPIYAYDHSLGTGSAIGGVFPEKGAYPSEYMQSYFFGDYSLDRIYRLSMDANDNIVSSEIFINGGAGGPVDFQAGPDGAIYYLGIYNGDIRRVVFSTANRAPTAAIVSNPSSGPSAPVSVSFSSADSGDPDGDPLSFSWSFGDGAASTAANPSHTYMAAGTYSTVLTVSDGRGGIGTAGATVRVGVPVPAIVPRHTGTTAEPLPTLIGRNALITANIANTGAAGPITVDFEIYNEAGAKVAQKVYEGEQIGENMSRDFTFNWFPPTTGAYRVAVGIFYGDWSGLYEWTDRALTVDVLARAPTGTFAPVHEGTAIAPSSVPPGTAAAIRASIKNNGDFGKALVDIEVYKDGVKVGQKFFDNEPFNAGTSRSFEYQFAPETAGEYRVSIGIFKPGWADIYSWHADAGLFAAGSGMAIYNDALASGWENWSWETAANFSKAPARNGSAAIGVQFATPWAGLYFRHAPFSLAGKSAVSLGISGGSGGGQQLQLIAFDELGNALPPKSLNAYGGILANQWTTMDVPLGDLGVLGKQITGFALQGTNGLVQNEFLLDNIVIR